VPSKNDYVLCGCVCVFFLENAWNDIDLPKTRRFI
jgi:hypothetical protein